MKPRLLFICVENANRSQIAEAFARLHGADHIEAYSAGSKPSGQVNPRAIQLMAERGYDLTKHVCKALDQVPQDGYAAVVTMGCGDACPRIAAPIQEDWALPDPKHLADEQFRAVRDDIERRVKTLLARLLV